MGRPRMYTDEERLERKRACKKKAAAKAYARNKQDPAYVVKVNAKNLNDYHTRIRPFPDKMEKRRLRIKSYQQKRRIKLNEIKIVLQQALGGECVSCGLTDSRLLDFDHIDPANKTMMISQSLSKPFELLLAEAKKCQLMCPNCHRIKTLEAGNFNAYRYREYRNAYRTAFKPLC